MEEETASLNTKQKGSSAFVSLLVYGISFFVLNLALYGVVYFFFIPSGVTDMASLTIFQLILTQLAAFLSVLVPAVMILRYLDCRPLSDLGFAIKGRGKDILFGLLIAVVLYGCGFGFSLAFGVISVTGVHPDWGWLSGSFLFYLLVAVTEELMFRGYILGRLLRTRMNKFLALFISSLMFACLHLANPNMAFLPMLNLILAGLLLGATYLYTHNLWLPISLHLFWNWLQGPVLGYEVSGNKFGESLLKLHLSDNTLLNGGDFGFEGSLICTVLMIALIGGVIRSDERNRSRD